jgi:flagellar hook-associated protein 1
MSGISLVLNIAKKALQTQQIAMEVMSHNVANVNTPGYTRQSPVIETESPYNQGLLKIGMGVRVESVTQAVDNYTTRSIHQNISDLKEYETKTSVLSQLETIFNEATDQGLSQMMNDFWSAWQDLANNPGGMAERTALLEKSESLCSYFHTMSNDLNQIANNLNTSLGTALQDVNQISEKIAALNDKIVAAESSGTPANDLRDERTNLLKELSGYIGNVYLEDENGSVTVMTTDGTALVSGNHHWELTQVGNNIYWNNIPKDISKNLTGGKIGGWLDLRDEVVPQYLANLDEIAGTLIQEVNTLHLTGYTLAGETNKYFFRNFQTTPNTPNTTDYGGAAAYITLSDDVKGIPANIAAGGQSGDPGDNENVLNIVGIQNDASIQIRKWTYDDRGASQTSALQTETIDEYYQVLTGDLGILSEDFSRKQDFTQSLVSHLEELRDSVSGVNIDEEMIELLKIQRAHQAASKIVSAADDLLKSILDMR